MEMMEIIHRPLKVEELLLGIDVAECVMAIVGFDHRIFKNLKKTVSNISIIQVINVLWSTFYSSFMLGLGCVIQF